MYILFHRHTSFSTILYMHFAIMETIFSAGMIQARLMTATAWTPHQIFSDISGGSSLPSGASHHAPPFPRIRGGHHCRGISFCPDTCPRPSRSTLLRQEDSTTRQIKPEKYSTPHSPHPPSYERFQNAEHQSKVYVNITPQEYYYPPVTTCHLSTTKKKILKKLK